MPLKAIDFSKTIIYKICKDDDFYVGSTTDYASRKSKHKRTCSNEKGKDYNFKLYQTIRDKGGWDSWEMTPLEEYVECKSQTQARIREEEWRVKLNASLNTFKAYRSEEQKQDYMKQYNTQYYKEHYDEIKSQQLQYYQEHADEIKAKTSQYYQEHAEEIKTKRAKKFDCECGGKYTYHGKSQHEKSQKHQKWEKSKK